MIYLLYGNERTMILNRIKKIRKELFEENDENIINFDLNNTKIYDLVDEINQMFLYGENKLIIVDNADFFMTEIKGKKEIELYNELYNALENISENISVIFIVRSTKVNQKNNIYKLILKNGKVLEFKDIQKTDWPIFANQFFKKRNITIASDAVEELIKRSNGDLSIFNNEANKLILYKINNITLADVQELVPQSLEDDVFKIMNALNAGDKTTALKVYRDLRIKNIEPITLINLFSSSLFYILNVKNLMTQKVKTDDIAKITGSSAGRVYMTVKTSKNMSISFVEQKLEQLAKLDKDIKHSKTDRFLAFETFLLEYWLFFSFYRYFYNEKKSITTYAQLIFNFVDKYLIIYQVY